VRVISGDQQYAEEFLEKFFPVQRRLPRVDEDLLAGLFDQGLDRICTKFGLLLSAPM